MDEIKDGTYCVEVTLTGGSGRAELESPTRLTKKDAKIWAQIRWDSPYYDYMNVEGREYYPVNKDGNSLFIIEAELDQEIPVKAETVAMSEPHMIEYALYFDSKSLKKEGGGAAAAICIGAAIGIVCAIIAVKRRKHEK